MGLLEIELARLDYRERLADAERGRKEAVRARSLRGRLRQEAKIDSPVLSFHLAGFRYRLWFTRTVSF
ncbi:hypothetical protein [Arthrobacter sp. 7Tela_A1]|uniref:hypothetical protein n=1 Tax=Arthrobacter sp. 7Tela_A1 TaxID=3093745 RepID=UPI003BB64656